MSSRSSRNVVWDRCRSVAEARKQQLQRPGALQERSVAPEAAAERRRSRTKSRMKSRMSGIAPTAPNGTIELQLFIYVFLGTFIVYIVYIFATAPVCYKVPPAKITGSDTTPAKKNRQTPPSHTHTHNRRGTPLPVMGRCLRMEYICVRICAFESEPESASFIQSESKRMNLNLALGQQPSGSDSLSRA